jgi:hypothetical protein
VLAAVPDRALDAFAAAAPPYPDVVELPDVRPAARPDSAWEVFVKAWTALVPALAFQLREERRCAPTGDGRAMQTGTEFPAAAAGAVPKESGPDAARQAQGEPLQYRCGAGDATAHSDRWPEAAAPEPVCREAVLPPPRMPTRSPTAAW